jgi:hypothetical protein
MTRESQMLQIKVESPLRTLKSSTQLKMRMYLKSKRRAELDKQRLDLLTRVQDLPNQEEESPCARKKLRAPGWKLQQTLILILKMKF